MRRLLYPFALMLPVLALLARAPAPVRGEPYLALNAGAKCAVCHVNRTGGGRRTVFGAMYPDLLRGQGGGGEAAFSGRVNAYFATGADLRADLTHTEIPNRPNTTAFAQRRMLLYLQADLLPGELTLYADQQLAPGSVFTREGFALLQGLPGNGYVKAGRFFLPYGWRLQDDSAFVRQAAQINYNNPDVGVELGLEPGPWSLHLAVTNGTQGAPEDNQQKMVTAQGVLVQQAWRAGVSYTRNRAGDGTVRTAGNLFGGLHTGPVNLLAEADLVRDEPPARPQRERLATLAEINAFVAAGMNLKLTYEYLDPNRDVDEDERDRTSLVFEPFLRRFTQLRAGVRINRGIPQNDLQNADEAFVELHVFF